MTDSTVTAQAARNELYEIVRKDIPFEQKATEALELGRQYLGADSGYLTRIDKETDYWGVVATTDDAEGMVPPGLEADLHGTYCRRTIESDGQITLHDAPNQGWVDDPAFKKYGLHCYHGTKLILNGEPYGTVCFGAEDPRGEFTDGETMFAELIAQLLERELQQAEHKAQLTKQTNVAIVLNRVLRHNLRNDISVIRGYTQIMAEQMDNPRFGEAALRNIDKLIRLAEKARQLDRVVAADAKSEPTDITELIEDIAQNVTKKYPHAAITINCDEPVTADVLPSFEQAVTELIENAAEHAGETPTVTVSVDLVPNAVEIRIADDGPGLAEHEASVLEAGTETPLTHGSGLGLWLAHWIVSSHDGSIEAGVTDDGTTMTVTIPRQSSSEVNKQLTKLRRAHDQYQAAFNEANDAMIMMNDDGHIIDANPGATDIFGMERQSLLGQSVQRFLPESFDFEAAWQAFQDAGRERKRVLISGADGVERQVEYSATADVVPGQHLFVARNITERVERDAELRSKTQAMDNAPVGITLADPHQEDVPLVYANERFCELSGYEKEEILGRNCRFMQGPETSSEAKAKFREAIEAEKQVSETILDYRKDGTTFWNRLTIAPIRDESGELMSYVGFQEDVTEEVEREQELKETTQRLEAIIEASPDAIVTLDADGTIQLWNEAATELFGYEKEAAIGEPILSLELHCGEQKSEFEQKFKRALNGEILNNHEITRQTKAGNRLQLSLSTAPITDESGAVTGVVGVISNLTSTESAQPA